MWIIGTVTRKVMVLIRFRVGYRVQYVFENVDENFLLNCLRLLFLQQK